MYTIHLRHMGKRRVDFLVVLIELILLAVMAEALRAKIHGTLAFCNGMGEFLPNFCVKEDVPHQSFLHG